jgi:hypothetical protein
LLEIAAAARARDEARGFRREPQQLEPKERGATLNK